MTHADMSAVRVFLNKPDASAIVVRDITMLNFVE